MSVQKAMKAVAAEIILVDNASSDETVAFVQDKFPQIQIIANKNNPGFSAANNQGAAMARGEYLLFLNPDTIVAEDCFSACIEQLHNNPGIAALGVKMIDGSGRFLPESKRGFPSPWNSLTKLSGLSSLFPKSKTFAGYYHGNLDENISSEVDALSGAFMMVRASVYAKSTGFDERFFMYGEDLDLSYRFQLMGYRNLYFPGTAIIHFKGESTRRDLRYVKQFYKAMDQFAKKHFNKGWAYPLLLKSGIGLISVLASIRKYFTNPVERKKAELRFGFEGDRDSMKEAKSIVGTNPDDLNSPLATVFCEGAEFSFREIIQTVLSRPPGQYWFHAKGSESVLSSTDKNGRGEIKSLARGL